jgi:hypothetical protein
MPHDDTTQRHTSRLFVFMGYRMTNISDHSFATLSRRNFMITLASAAGAGALGFQIAASADARAATALNGESVASIHMDLPFLDSTGRALPYRPPIDVQCGAPFEHLGETLLRTHHCYL